MPRVPPTLRFAADYGLRLLIVIAAAVVGGYILVRLSSVLLPVAIALLLSTLLAPVAGRLRGVGVPRALAALAVLLAAVLLLSLLIGSLVPAVAGQFSALSAGVRAGLGRATTLLVEGPFGLSAQEIDMRINEALGQARGNLGGLAGRALNGALIAVNVFAGLVLTLFLTFFFIKDGREMWEWFVRLIRPEWREDAQEMGRRAWKVLRSYVRGVVVVAIVDAVLIGLALLVTGVPLIVPLMLITFLGAFFPVIGAVVAGAFAVLVALVTQGGSTALFVLGAIIVIQQVEGNILYPYLVGPALALHPVAVLLALSAGTVLAGVVGALFSVPIAAVVSVCAAYVRERSHGAPVENAGPEQAGDLAVP
jgi:predicted PurR-regulated permease PerM